MNKEELRKVFLQKRKSLTEAELAQFNLQIYNQFFAHIDLSFIKILHVYLPLAKNKEPDTWQIIDRIRREFPHIRISIPKVDNITGELEHYYFDGLHQIETNRWGIPEPKEGVITPPEKIDMVIIPLLVFDGHGNRVGYGKGFYDRFLKDCRADCKKIGLSFFPPVDLINDVNKNDVSLCECITPSKVFAFGSTN